MPGKIQAFKRGCFLFSPVYLRLYLHKWIFTHMYTTITRTLYNLGALLVMKYENFLHQCLLVQADYKGKQASVSLNE